MKPKPAQPEPQPVPPQSFLFTFRLWQTRSAQGDSAWRGKLESVTTGEVRYLNGLQGVSAQLRELLHELEPEINSEEESHGS